MNDVERVITEAAIPIHKAVLKMIPMIRELCPDVHPNTIAAGLPRLLCEEAASAMFAATGTPIESCDQAARDAYAAIAAHCGIELVGRKADSPT